jgi:hypothetical protein
MSALGHKPTYAVQNGMSALPPMPRKRTSANAHVCSTPRKRTCAVQLAMSAKGQKRTYQEITQSQRLQSRAALARLRGRALWQFLG